MQLVFAVSNNILYMVFSFKIHFIHSERLIFATDDAIDWTFGSFIVDLLKDMF